MSGLVNEDQTPILMAGTNFPEQSQSAGKLI